MNQFSIGRCVEAGAGEMMRRGGGELMKQQQRKGDEEVRGSVCGLHC